MVTLSYISISEGSAMAVELIATLLPIFMPIKRSYSVANADGVTNSRNE